MGGARNESLRPRSPRDPEWRSSGRRRARRRPSGGGAGLAGQEHHGRGSARRRERQRRDRAGRHGPGRQAAGRHHRGGEPSRRRRHHRRQHGREGAARRLYDPGLRGAGERERAVQEAALRRAERSHSRDCAGPAAAGGGDAARPGLEDAGRHGGGREGQAGRAQLFVGGRRIGLAFRRPTHPRQRRAAGAGSQAQAIPLKGAAEAVTEVVSGRADFSVQLFATTLSLLRDGQLSALAVSADRRTSSMPQVPTTIEAGLPANSVYPFYSALYVPAHTPPDIVGKIERETAAALRAPTVQAQFAQLGVEPMPRNREQFAKFFRDDVAANLELVKIAKIPTQ